METLENNYTTLINPYKSLKAAITAAGIPFKSGYVRTCHSDTCACGSHDPGYHWIEVKAVDAEKLPPYWVWGGSLHSHPISGLVAGNEDVLNEDGVEVFNNY